MHPKGQVYWTWRCCRSTLFTCPQAQGSKPASVLVDTTNIAPAVQLKDQDVLVRGIPEDSQVSGKDEQTKKFEELINKAQYKEIAELGEKMSDKELLKCLCQVVTTLDHFKGLYEYLTRRNMVSGFLANGEMVLVRKIITELGLLDTNDFGCSNNIYDAMALSLNEDHHERVAGLLEAAQERPNWKHMFDWFVWGFFDRYPFEQNRILLKRFSCSSVRGEFGKKHPAIFKTTCRKFVEKLKCQLDDPAYRPETTD